MLVDQQGNPLGDWKTAPRPVVRWDLSKETDPDLVKELRSGLHSERVASFYLKLKMQQANTTTTKGLSERIPCESIGNMCRKNLYEQTLFPKLTTMRYLTRRGQSSDEVKAGTDAASALRSWYQGWEAAGMPIGLDANVRMITANLFSTPDSANPGGVLATGLAAGATPAASTSPASSCGTCLKAPAANCSTCSTPRRALVAPPPTARSRQHRAPTPSSSG